MRLPSAATAQAVAWTDTRIPPRHGKTRGSAGTLAGQVALITGGGTGIGAAIARRLVDDGARACVTGRHAGPLDKVLGSLPAG